MHFIVKRPPSL